MDWECWQCVPIPPTSLHQLWATMVCRPSTSTDFLSPITIIRPLRFWLEVKCWPIPEWFYRTPRLRHRCCDGLRGLAGCSHTYIRTLPDLHNNGLPSFHLNGSLSTPIRTLRFWLGLKCLPIHERFHIHTGYDTGAVMD